MASTVEAALEYNKGALAAIWSQLSGATVPSSPRNDLVWAYVLITLKHHEGIHALTSQDLMAPAFALLRSQIETAYRGLWVNLIATDEQVKAIRENDAEPFPKFRQMAADLDAAYGAISAPPSLAAAIRMHIAAQQAVRRPPILPEVLDFIAWAALLALVAAVAQRFLPLLGAVTNG